MACDIGWRCHHLRRGLEGHFWGCAAEICHENLEPRWFRKTRESCGSHMDSRLLTMFIPNACLSICQKCLQDLLGRNSSAQEAGFLVVIYESSTSKCFSGFWFVAATPVMFHGFGARFRSPAQGRAGAGANPVSSVAALIALRLERWPGLKLTSRFEKVSVQKSQKLEKRSKIQTN